MASFTTCSIEAGRRRYWLSTTWAGTTVKGLDARMALGGGEWGGGDGVVASAAARYGLLRGVARPCDWARGGAALAAAGGRRASDLGVRGRSCGRGAEEARGEGPERTPAGVLWDELAPESEGG
jgi:hypothetical protein